MIYEKEWETIMSQLMKYYRVYRTSPAPAEYALYHNGLYRSHQAHVHMNCVWSVFWTVLREWQAIIIVWHLNNEPNERGKERAKKHTHTK